MVTRLPRLQALWLTLLLCGGCAANTPPRNAAFAGTHAIEIDGEVRAIYPGDLLLDVLRRAYPASTLGDGAEEPDVVVDGVRTPGIRWLAAVPAVDIESVRRVRAIDAFHSYGARSRVGVIVVKTRRGSR